MQPAAQLLQAKSTFPAFARYAAELVLGGSRHLGEKSIVVIPSLSGTTKESIAAMEYCRARGATIITLVGHAAYSLGEGGDHAFVNFAEDDTSSESFYLQSLFIAAPRSCVTAASSTAIAYFLRFCQPDALSFRLCRERRPARSGRRPTTTACAYSRRCNGSGRGPVHASDFFHGTLELVEDGVSLILLKGEDEYRPLADRVEAFAREKTDRLTVFDTANQELAGISSETRALISPIVLATTLERVSDHLARKRNHPLTTRRYYRRVVSGWLRFPARWSLTRSSVVARTIRRDQRPRLLRLPL